MARFAGECKLKINKLTNHLEKTLGPGMFVLDGNTWTSVLRASRTKYQNISSIYFTDTGDLYMRFGIHSGPVTVRA